MTQIFRRTAVSGLSLALAAFFAFAGSAHAQGEVTVGGAVEVVGGVSDHAMGVDGLDRGLFSRINVGYSNTLENGLTISGSISYQVNQRGDGSQLRLNPSDLGLTADGQSMVMVDPDMMAEMMMDNPDMTPAEALDMGMNTRASTDQTTNYAPDILSISVGGGFGTVSVGAHAAASCAMLPRPIAFVPAGVNFTWYTLFSGFSSQNGTFSESNYCGTSEAISYATPTMGGLSAMVTYAPNMSANQGVSIGNAVRNVNADGLTTNMPDYVAVAGSFSTDMGAANIAIGASFQTSGANEAGAEIDSQSIAGTFGMGGASFGASWFDNGSVDGINVAAKYALGAITPGILYSTQEFANGQEETALTIGASYALGGGLSIMVEYMALEESGGALPDNEDTLLMSAISVAF